MPNKTDLFLVGGIVLGMLAYRMFVKQLVDKVL